MLKEVLQHWFPARVLPVQHPLNVRAQVQDQPVHLRRKLVKDDQA